MFDDLLAANADHARTFTGGELPGKAARHLALVTCMDSRLDPLAMLGLGRGDAVVLRNPGGRVTDDVLRSLVLAHHLLEVDRVAVVVHTRCKMASSSDDEVHRVIAARGVDSRSLEPGTVADQVGTLRSDVQRVRSSPYLPADLPVMGARYDVTTGRLEVLDR